MINYGLPKSVTVNGKEYKIRSDFRAILDIVEALNDVNLNEQEKAYVVLDIFYEDFDEIPFEDMQEAVNECFKFIEGGKERTNNKAPKLVDWEKDFPLIISPINAVAGHEIRSDDYCHWWTFLGYYNEISGDCTFAQVVRIRDKDARGVSLDKSEREWKMRNLDLVDMPSRYTDEEEEILKAWGGNNGK